MNSAASASMVDKGWCLLMLEEWVYELVDLLRHGGINVEKWQTARHLQARLHEDVGKSGRQEPIGHWMDWLSSNIIELFLEAYAETTRGALNSLSLSAYKSAEKERVG